MNVRVIARVAGNRSQVPDRLTLDDRAATRHELARACTSARNSARCPRRVCGRADLAADWTAGPLLVEEFDSTTVVPPDGRARLHRLGHHRDRARAMTNLHDAPDLAAPPRRRSRTIRSRSSSSRTRWWRSPTRWR